MTLPVVFTANGPSGYNLTKSLRFRSSASAYLIRTNTTPTNANKWTWSGWVKRGALGSQNSLFGAWKTTNGVVQCYFQSNDTLRFYASDATNTTYVDYQTSAVYRDPSAWYHVVVGFDNTGVTASVNIYVNGTQVTSFGTSSNNLITLSSVPFNLSGSASYIGQARSTANSAFGYFDGYQAEINFVDGQQLTPSSFGSTNSTTGVWQPAKYTGTYGTNGFYLKFTDTTSTSTLGTDYSGNSNTWTVNNISLTTGSTYDSMNDVPTLTSATTANYCVFNPLNCNSNITLSNGNLSATSSTNGANTVIATMPIPSTGKAYWEYKITAVASSLRINLGAASTTSSITPTVNPSNIPNAFALNWATGFSVVVNGSYTYGPTGSTNLAVNDVVMIAYDATTGNLWGGLNGTWYNSGNPAAGTGSITTMTAGLNWLPYAYLNTSGGANATDVNFGQQPFAYTQPTGFNSINAYNLPTSTIVAGNTVMDATTYTGTGSSYAVTNSAGFKPDFVWVKERSQVQDHALFDSVRGATKQLSSNTTGAEATYANSMSAFNSNGFTVVSDAVVNSSGQTYVGWQWQAGQGSSSSNTSGSITSTVSVNASASFSVVTFTAGSGASPSYITVGHGLGVAPNMVIVKRRGGAGAWYVYHTSLATPATQWLQLNTTDAVQTATPFWGSSGMTSSTLGFSDSLLINSSTYVAYCWSQIAGFSSFGKYTGNGSTDGTFVYTGFRPKFVLLKVSSGTTANWVIIDSARNTYNVANLMLNPDASDAEFTTTMMDFTANGFKLRTAAGTLNGSGYTYIYAAFAENPFKNALAR